MSDTDGKKPLGLRGGGRPGNVKQSFSHGRTKNVVVETKRKRVVVPKPGAAKSGAAGAAPRVSDPSKRPAGISDAEMDRRMKALQAAKEQEVADEARRKAEEEERAKDRERRRAEAEAKEREEKEREERARQKAEDDERKKREAAEAKARAAAPAAAEAQPSAPVDAGGPRGGAPKPSSTPARKDRDDRDRNKGKARGDDGRRSGKLTLNQALRGGEGGRQKSLAAMKRKQERARQKAMGGNVEREKVVREVQLPEAIMVSELANRMAERVADVVKSLMTNGIMATQTQTIDADTAELIIEEFGHKVVRVSDSDVEDVIAHVEDDEKDLKSRPPVITVMGHVDHGKTSLLDAIRNARVTAGEAGGITQHIGAYQVEQNGNPLTFLDTPGHAAFTSMRARGAQVTDIVILVVAADDAVMPQTIEAINHAKAAEVPMIVAINKIDRPEANPDKVRTDLLQHEVIVEKMSGEVQDVEVSAVNGTGLEELLEAISLQSELLELKSNPDRAASGAVIEAQLDVGRGPVATVLVQNGTLRQGDIFVVGEQWGKVRAMENDQGERVKEAGPSVPVEVLGLNGTPEAGDVLNVVDTEAQAREIAEYREKAAKDKRAAAGAATTLEQLMANAKADESVNEMPIVVKADVQGSAEAIVQAMEKIGNDEVRVRVLHSGVGAITESDIGLAEASGAPVFGFNVRANAPARNSANQKGIEIRYYSVIYDLVDDVKQAASGLLSAEIKENFIGYAEIREVFKVTGVGKVAGCLVTEGVARRSAGVRLLRDNVVIHEGTLKTLKRFKDEVPEVQSGQECGMAFEAYDDIRPGDVIEIFEREEVERNLD
ncbi:translation initiation factor IF-2 [Litoreibacter roseus]|uniref:Translation initiation factor IF-2 n=1 Tax=Litoreibacter roseus TaxID=2601869 RepID=A0A6N6JF10_9RHOB|nr:translation initiation factor IF-2 [Litoreibacter roseus]GFE64537.1 translation initiation factor IF-2 [Litoreibacter roseus]